MLPAWALGNFACIYPSMFIAWFAIVGGGLVIMNTFSDWGR